MIDLVTLSKKITASRSEVHDRKKILIVSNVTLYPLDEIVEVSLFDKQLYFSATMGDFDTVWQSAQSDAYDYVIIHLDILNMAPGFLTRYSDPDYLSSLTEHFEQCISGLKQAREHNSNKLIACALSSQSLGVPNFNAEIERLIYRFNANLSQVADVLINYDQVLFDSNEAKFNWAQYYRYTAPYSFDLLNGLAEAVVDQVTKIECGYKKVLVLDCDNTLWGGIIGEDTLDEIDYSDATPAGKCFFEVQSYLKMLADLGVILCLCSKNNEEDVVVFFEKMQGPIKWSDITAHKINWDDKAKNIVALAEKLNLGLDSFVFLDDSSFEINHIKSCLPEVSCYQVPSVTFDYPYFFRRHIMPCFKLSGITQEDMQRKAYYANESLRTTAKLSFDSIEAYLSSLDLSLSIKQCDDACIERVAQMSNKTNQFNLTTRRYSVNEIRALVDDANSLIYVGSVADKFGDSGITVLAIVKKTAEDLAEVVCFLMSCRVIGRHLELAFFDFLVKKLKAVGVKQLKSSYLSTPKNAQVEDFYDRLGFNLESKNEQDKYYRIDLNQYQMNSIAYIGVHDGT